MPVQHLIRRLIWISVAPLVLLALALPWMERERDRALWEHALDDDVRAAARMLESRLALRLHALELLAASSSLAGDAPDLQGFRREALAYRAAFDAHVILGDTSRHMLLNTRVPEGQALPPLPIPAGRSAVESSRASGLARAGDPFTGPVALQPLVALAVPVPALPGGPPSPLLVLAQIEVAQLQRWLDESSVSPGSRLLLLASTSAPMARREAAQAGDGWQTRLVLPLAGSPWRLVQEATDIGWHAGLGRTALLLALALGLAATMAYVGTRRAGRILKSDLDALVGLPKAGAAAPVVAEVAAVRRRLDDMATQRERHERELEASRASLQRLLANQDQVQEQERARIARELHDDLQQRLALVVSQAQALKTGSRAGTLTRASSAPPP